MSYETQLVQLLHDVAQALDMKSGRTWNQDNVIY